jgi:hypothetical protein
MQKKRKSPWPFQEVLGFLRHFILLFGAYDSTRQKNVMPWAAYDSPTLKLVAIPILPLPAVTGYYLSPRHEKFIFRPFTGETEGHHVLSQLFDWLYLPHFLLLKWVVVKYNGVPLPALCHDTSLCKEFRFVNSGSEQATVQNFEREKLLVTTVTFQISLHMTQQPLCLESPTSSVRASRTAAPLARAGSCPCGAKRLSHRTVAGAGVQRKHAFVPRWPSN